MEVSRKKRQMHINDVVKGGLQLVQVMNFVVKHQKKDVDCVEDIFHRPVNRPIRRTEEDAVPPAPQEARDHGVVVDVQVVHGEAEAAPGVINVQLITDPTVELIHSPKCRPSLGLLPHIVPLHVVLIVRGDGHHAIHFGIAVVLPFTLTSRLLLEPK